MKMENIFRIIKEEIMKEMGFNPRMSLPKVRKPGWTKNKILRWLRQNSTRYGYSFAIKLIAEFDNVEELKEHIFWHGAPFRHTALKPSIAIPRFGENDGGGGYGEKYWAISVTKRKSVATSFIGTHRNLVIHPIILAKDAIVKDMSKQIRDSDELEDIIEELWNEGVDAVWIGGGEQELCVLNPHCICTIGENEYHQVYGLDLTKFNNPTIEMLEELLNACKDYLEFKKTLPRKPIKPFLHARKNGDRYYGYDENGEFTQRTKEQYDSDVNDYNIKMADYNKQMDDYNNNDIVKQYNDKKNIIRKKLKL